MLVKGRPIAEDAAEWSRWLGQSEDESETTAIRRATATGSPCGPASFAEGLETQLRRRLRRRPYRSAKHGAEVDLPRRD